MSDVEELGSISLIGSMITSLLKSNELKVDDIPGREFVATLSSVFSGLLNTEEKELCHIFWITIFERTNVGSQL